MCQPEAAASSLRIGQGTAVTLSLNITASVRYDTSCPSTTPLKTGLAPGFGSSLVRMRSINLYSGSP